MGKRARAAGSLGFRVAVIAVCVFVLAGILSVGYTVARRIDTVDYEGRLVEAFGFAGDDGVTAEIDGVRTVVNTANREKLRSWLTLTERRSTRYTSDPDARRFTVQIGGMTVTVEETDPSLDRVVYTATEGRWSRTYSVEGYNLYYWLSRTAGSEGYYGANEIVD